MGYECDMTLRLTTSFTLSHIFTLGITVISTRGFSPCPMTPAWNTLACVRGKGRERPNRRFSCSKLDSVLLTAFKVVVSGLPPNNGELLWRHPMKCYMLRIGIQRLLLIAHWLLLTAQTFQVISINCPMIVINCPIDCYWQPSDYY